MITSALAVTKKTATAGKEVTQKSCGKSRRQHQPTCCRKLPSCQSTCSGHTGSTNSSSHCGHDSLFTQKTLVMVMYFAEKYACQYQEEVQLPHWHHTQVTTHPIRTCYACSSCEGLVNKSLVFISNDLTHDYHAVQN